MNLQFLQQLEQLLNERRQSAPEGSYTGKLFTEGLDKILQKVGEEATEFIIDAKNKDQARIVSEGADLVFHLMMALIESDLSFQDIINELEKRHK